MQSSRLQHIANISEERFERYVQETRERRASITAAGLLRAARRYAAGSSQVHAGEAPAEAYWEGVWDAVTRVMDLDVCVGVSARKLGAPKFLRPEQAMQAQLSGNVLVRTTKEVEPWLETLAQGRERRRIVEAMILFVPRTGLAWFRLVDTGGWICCFLENPGSPSRAYALAYHGERQHAFCLVFRELGAVLRAPQF